MFKTINNSLVRKIGAKIAFMFVFASIFFSFASVLEAHSPALPKSTATCSISGSAVTTAPFQTINWSANVVVSPSEHLSDVPVDFHWILSDPTAETGIVSSNTSNAQISRTYSTAGLKNATLEVTVVSYTDLYPNVTLDCSGLVGNVIDPNPAPLATVDLQVNGGNGPVAVNSGESVTLSWTSTNASSCTATSGWSGAKSTFGTEIFGPLSTNTNFGITCVNSGGVPTTDTVNVSVNVVPVPAPTVDLQINGADAPVSLSSGETATLSWTSTNAVSCTASGVWSGSKVVSGTETVGPISAGGVYTITCENSAGVTISDSVTINFEETPGDSTATCTLSASTVPAISANDTVIWTVGYTSNIAPTFVWSGTDGLSGNTNSATITYPTDGTKDATITLTAVGLNPILSCDSLTYVVDNTPAPLATVDLQVNGGNGPVAVTSGSTVDLSWTSTNAVSCTASGVWSGAKAVSGSEASSAIVADSAFTITCQNIDGVTVSDTVNVTISGGGNNNPTVNIQANGEEGPVTVNDTDVVTLSWTSTNSTSCTATGNWTGSKATSGSEIVSPSVASTFTLECTDGSTTSTDSVVVNVNGAIFNPTVDLKVNGGEGPVNASLGGTAELTWTTTNSTSCIASGAWGGTKAVSGGSENVGPFNTSGGITFTLTCQNGALTSSDTITVNVTGGNGGGGGGGGSRSGGGSNLFISNEKIQEIAPGVVFVQWDTNKPASRKVVFGDNTIEIASSTLSTFGYDSETVNITDPYLTSHGMAVLNLEPGKTYYFRPVSSNGYQTALGQELVINPNVVTESCQYLYDYLRIDWNNNPVEVRKLQVFLRDLEGMDVAVTGVFDEQTFNAVKIFQDKYKGDIISPWGHDASTGFVYILTKKKINEIYCKATVSLTEEQQNEIAGYKTFIEGLNAEGLVTTPASTTTVPSIMVPTTTIDIDTNTIEEIGSLVSTSTVALVSSSTEREGFAQPIINLAATALSLPGKMPVAIKYGLIDLGIMLALYGIIGMFVKDKGDKGQRDNIRLLQIMSFITSLVVIAIISLVFRKYGIAIPLAIVSAVLLPVLVWLGIKKENTKFEVKEVDLTKK